jgi:hypothetical protein
VTLKVDQVIGRGAVATYGDGSSSDLRVRADGYARLFDRRSVEWFDHPEIKRDPGGRGAERTQRLTTPRSVVGIVAAGDGEVPAGVDDFLQLFADFEER